MELKRHLVFIQTTKSTYKTKQLAQPLTAIILILFGCRKVEVLL